MFVPGAPINTPVCVRVVDVYDQFGVKLPIVTLPVKLPVPLTSNL